MGDRLSTARNSTNRYRFGIVPGILLKPDKYGNTTTDLIYVIYIYISYIRIDFSCGPYVPEDFVNILTSEDLPSSVGGF